MANSTDLGGCKVAILALDGFEQVELTEPRRALQDAGATAEIVSAKPGEIQGFNHDKPADKFKVDATLDRAKPDDYDAVLLPGGVMNGDTLRINPHAQKFVQAMQQAGKPIAVICHGGWLLVSSGLVKGRHMTSWPTLQDDIRNAGGQWSDEPVVRDANWVSSRKPDDIPQFNAAMLELLGSRVAAH
ncbi:type 1 glutamine amidotransferase domain-containing protein [Ramlibacter algicola]|uniref:Type 1 glutamine amidotransferase n=1 Tax=Ramlibacter algicola TaxID=2795217 RepID=A0A934PYG0_9BURK|nr:type 1 glutamine amidotransferase domain-containing protein [Ramlibacter algicola]MBK0391890.1 type 1 glutamine amidotransferase [Ramlibacter algicola]